MTVRELIEQIKDYPDATVCISMGYAFTDSCILENKNDKTILISEF